LSKPNSVKAVEVALVKASLPNPINFGSWIMTYREYAVVRVTAQNGAKGLSFGLTRDGAVAEQIQKSICKIYEGTSVEDRENTFWQAKNANLGSHSNGVGLRALSLVDLAMWDLAARSRDISIAELLQGACDPMPATAIVGYPPNHTTLDDLQTQILTLSSLGWNRFKIPFSDSPELAASKLFLMRKLAPSAWIGCDAAWRFRDVESALSFLSQTREMNLGWFEDVFPPGYVKELAQLRIQSNTPIAMGDEQGGSYYPQAMIDGAAVDVIRIDLTCMGGISGMKTQINDLISSGKTLSPHMFAHVHSPVLSAMGYADLPIEWGVPWTGVDPYADSLIQPIIDPQGRMLPLPQGPGFNELINRNWVSTQEFYDPHGVLGL
jgi:L-alanine-DL-glutamate epimerase-like enolase superfamily enzyme